MCNLVITNSHMVACQGIAPQHTQKYRISVVLRNKWGQAKWVTEIVDLLQVNLNAPMHGNISYCTYHVGAVMSCYLLALRW